MKLSDAMSFADLAIYAEVGLVLFLAAFVMVMIKVMVTKSNHFDEAVRIPFEDGSAGAGKESERKGS